MRRFVVIGQRATASPDFSLNDVAGTSGRLDVLLRSIRAALMISHGLRTDAVVYLVLLGGHAAPRTVRIEGAIARFLRPDERSLATLVQKALAAPKTPGYPFVTLRRGITVFDGGLETVLADLGPSTFYWLDENGADIRNEALDLENPVFFLGDPQGFDEATLARLSELRAERICLGPVSVHTDDAITLLWNDSDRRSPPA